MLEHYLWTLPCNSSSDFGLLQFSKGFQAAERLRTDLHVIIEALSCATALPWTPITGSVTHTFSSSLEMATPGPMNPDAVVAQVKRLINTQLKAVLKSLNLPVSGAKATLQQRIIGGTCYPQVPPSRPSTKDVTRQRHDSANMVLLDSQRYICYTRPMTSTVSTAFVNESTILSQMLGRLHHPQPSAPSRVIRVHNKAPMDSLTTLGKLDR